MEEPTFSRGPARRPTMIGGDPLLQWATGLQTKERRIYAGWLAECGKNEDFDRAMNAAGFETIVIKHGTGSLVEHWAVETARLFVMADGVQSIGEMKHTSERYGIAFGWRTLEGGRQQSVLKLRAHLHELIEIGFNCPVMVSVKSTLTGDLIAALTRQYEVLTTIDTIRKADGKPPMDPPFYACSIPIGPGEEVARGSGGQTKEITPPIARIPDPITREYIAQAWAKKAWVPLIEKPIDETIMWSIRFSQQIGAGLGADFQDPAE